MLVKVASSEYVDCLALTLKGDGNMSRNGNLKQGRRSSAKTSAKHAGLSKVIENVEKNIKSAKYPPYAPGDSVRVHVKIKEGAKERIQPFEGIVIKKGGRGKNRAFTVRKISHGVGVERNFMESSSKVVKLEVLQRGKVRRAKLYYLRELEGRAAKIKQRIDKQTKSTTQSASDPS